MIEAALCNPDTFGPASTTLRPAPHPHHHINTLLLATEATVSAFRLMCPFPSTLANHMSLLEDRVRTEKERGTETV